MTHQFDSPSASASPEGAVLRRFQKKPVVIEAMQVPLKCSATDPGDPFVRFMGGESQRNIGWTRNWRTGRVSIITLEGTMVAEVGDWVIRGVKGELYPCKPDIFALTYESEAAVRQLPSGPAAETWRDIETAPKDGTDVLVASSEGIDIANWQEEKPDGTECGVVVDPGLPEGWYGYLGLCPWDAKPTHWMPLPALPPSAAPGEGDGKNKSTTKDM